MYFEESAVPIYKKMWSFMFDTYTQQLRAQQYSNTSDTVMANTYAEGIDKVRRSKVIPYHFILFIESHVSPIFVLHRYCSNRY